MLAHPQACECRFIDWTWERVLKCYGPPPVPALPANLVQLQLSASASKLSLLSAFSLRLASRLACGGLRGVGNACRGSLTKLVTLAWPGQRKNKGSTVAGFSRFSSAWSRHGGRSSPRSLRMEQPEQRLTDVAKDGGALGCGN